MKINIMPCISILNPEYLASRKCKITTTTDPTIGPCSMLIPPITVASIKVIVQFMLKALVGSIYPWEI